MNNLSGANIAVVEAFFSALEQHKKEALAPLLDKAVVEVIPLSMSGEPTPEEEFKGKDAVMGYLGTIIDNFSRTVLKNKRFHVVEGGATIFVEGNGDLVHAQTLKAYNNIYVFKFDLRDGLITHIAEYANPVAYAKLTGKM